MTQTHATDDKTRQTLGQGMKLAIDFGPIAIFMVTYNVAARRVPDEAIFIATGVFIVATLLALGYTWLKERRLSPMLLVSGVIVTVFGGMTLIFHDALFIKLKPTIVNLLYASVIFGGLLVGRNVWKMLFASAFTLPDKIWNTLAVRWGAWFVFLAILNEVVWRAPPNAFWLQWTGMDAESFWANFKFFGVLPLTLIFAFANLPITAKYLGKTEMEEPDTPPSA
jgi:intracellular septation protein